MRRDEGDRLDALGRALERERGLRGVFDQTEAFVTGAQQMMRRLPAWAHDDQAAGVYALAFEDGYLAALHRLRIVLGLPEARGRETAASVLALDPALALDEIAARLRTAVEPAQEADCGGNVVSFCPRKRSSPS